MRVVPVGTRKLKPSTVDEGGLLRMAWLGVGSAFAALNSQTNVLVVKGETLLLIDCGTTASRMLVEIGLTPLDIPAVLPTHSHADHVGGLEELALKGRYMAPFVKGGAKGDHKPTCVITEEYQSYLWNFSLRGGLAFSEQMVVDGTPGEMRFTDYFEPLRPRPISGYDRPSYRVEHGDLEMILMRTKHIPEEPDNWEDCFWSCGVVLDGKVFYPGDTRLDLELLQQYVTDEIEAIFHDSQSFPGGVHASLEELKTLPQEFRERMWLVHLDDNMLKLDGEAAKQIDAALEAMSDLRASEETTPQMLFEGHLAVQRAKEHAMDAAESVVRSYGFAGIARPATECYYDFA